MVSTRLLVTAGVCLWITAKTGQTLGRGQQPAAAWAGANYSVHSAITGDQGANTAATKENCFTDPALIKQHCTETCDPVSWCHGVITQLS